MPLENEIAEIRDDPAIKERREGLVEYPNVWSTGVGYRYQDGQQTDEPAVLAFVKSKEDRNQLEDSDVLPHEIEDSDGESVTVDVKKHSIPTEDGGAAIRKEKLRPLIGGPRPGVEGKYNGGVGGTLGGIWQHNDGSICGVTNGHVAWDDEANKEDVIGKSVYQPGSDDEANKIGVVKDLNYSVAFDGDDSDWATVELDDGITPTNNMIGLGELLPPEEPSFDRPVIVTGNTPDPRTTAERDPDPGLRHAELIATDVTGPDSRIHTHVYSPVTGSGDSGSITCQWDPVEQRPVPIALHYTSDSDGSYGVDLGYVFEDAGLNSPVESTQWPDLTDIDLPAEFEGTVIATGGNRTVDVLVANLGAEAGETTVELRDADTQSILESQTVTLEPFEREIISGWSYGSADNLSYDTGDFAETFRAPEYDESSVVIVGESVVTLDGNVVHLTED